MSARRGRAIASPLLAGLWLAVASGELLYAQSAAKTGTSSKPAAAQAGQPKGAPATGTKGRTSTASKGQVKSAAPLAGREELVRLDALLTAGDIKGAASFLDAIAPQIAKDERLAFDTIYVLLSHDREAEARAQWNGLAPRLREALGGPSASTQAGQRRMGEALFAQALLMAQEGAGPHKQEALQFLQQADGLGFPPLESPLMLLAAECLVDLQEYTPATSAYAQYLERRPGDARARAGLGTALFFSGKLAAARIELEAALSADPKIPRANYSLGSVLFQLKEYDAARQRLERELALDPACAPCLSRLAYVAYVEGDDQRCEAWLDKARAADPDAMETRMVSGLLAMRRGQFQAAIEHLSLVAERSPDFAPVRFQLSNAYRRTGQPDKAREQFEVYQRLLKEQKAREVGFRGEQ